MIDHLKFLTAIFVIFIGLPLLIVLARDWLTRPSKKKMQELSREFNERLLNPDFLALERYFGCPVPSCLRALYADQKELMRSNFVVAAMANAPEHQRWYVEGYSPADEKALKERWPGIERYFAFADDGGGNGYLIDPKQADPTVLHHDHETGEITQVCETLTEFMKWPRSENEG